MLTVFLDSISIDAVYNENQILLKDLLSRDCSLFKIFRTKCDIDNEQIKRIPSKGMIEKKQFSETTLNTIYQKLLFWPKNPCQEQFFFYLLRYASRTNNPHYIHESAYVSSKFALEGLSESIAYELEQFGIKVILIEPGVIKTNFDNNLKIGKGVSIATTTIDHDSPYADITEKRIAGFKPRFENGTPAIEVANVILNAITSRNISSELRYLVGNDALKLMELRKNKSDKGFRRLVMQGVLK